MTRRPMTSIGKGLRALAVVVVAIAIVAALHEQQKKGVVASYRAQLDNAFGLTVGSNVTVAGVRAGRITHFSITRTLPPKAVVSFEITEQGQPSFHRDAVCRVRQQSLIGEYYIDCAPGTARAPLRSGATIPVSQTSSTIPLDLVNNGLRLPYRERLRLIIDELGTGLAGRPQELSRVLHRAHPGLRETTATLAILARQRREIRSFITDSHTVLRDLARRKADVARWIVAARRASEPSAAESRALAAGFHRLPTFLAELHPTMDQLRTASDEQVPLLRKLQASAPQLNRFLDQLGGFSEEGRPALRSLGRASVAGRDALAASARDVDQLRVLARSAPGAGRPLRQFLQTMDDRSRAREPDPRAAQTAPPPPDPTADAKGKGFTGFEDFWNWIYFQTLATNPFDTVSHFLRVTLIHDDACSPYSVDPSKQLAAQCGTYLGPSQPGILGQPDPTPPLPADARPSSSASRAALDYLMR